MVTQNFKNKIIRQIRWWMWASAALPALGFSIIFFIWVFGTNEILGSALVIGEIVMFTVVVIWWWWALPVIRNIIKQWDLTRETIEDVSLDIKEIKKEVREILFEKTAKDK